MSLREDLIRTMPSVYEALSMAFPRDEAEALWDRIVAEVDIRVKHARGSASDLLDNHLVGTARPSGYPRG